MPLFKKKSEVLCMTCDVPGWEDSQFSSLAREWALGTGLSENWDGKLQTADPPRVVEVLKTVPIEKEGELMAVTRHGWILLTAYCRMCQHVNGLIEEKCALEKETADLQSKLAVLQCQNYILGDQARACQTIAEKSPVRYAQYKYRKRRGMQRLFRPSRTMSMLEL